MSRTSMGRPSAVGARAAAVLLACIGAALLLGAVARSAAGPVPSFAGPSEYRTGEGPEGVTLGDLNGDGRLDLATANFNDDTVSVLVNRGDGSFEHRRDYWSGPSPWSVAIGDLDGDGIQGVVSVLLNRGDGGFQAARDYRTGAGPEWLAIADLNGDRGLDMVTSTNSDTASVLLNATGRCGVPKVRGKTLPNAKRELARANCRVGKVRRDQVKGWGKGRVISQKPVFGAVRRAAARVDLVVSRGPR